MKRFLISAGILTTVLPSTANAKGCIKGAIVGGLAGHMTGHGKVGAVAGCVIGRHEAPSSKRASRGLGHLYGSTGLSHEEQ